MSQTSRSWFAPITGPLIRLASWACKLVTGRPLLLALCLMPTCAMADPVVHGPFANPRTGDSWDNDPSLLMKLLDVMAATQSGAAHAAFASITATTDGNATFPARATRRRVGWVNASSETTYISFASGTTGTAGLTVVAGATGGMNYTGPIYAHSASGTARVDFAETYD